MNKLGEPIDGFNYFSLSRLVVFIVALAVNALIISGLQYVLTQFADIFKQMQSELPWLTRIVLATYEFWNYLPVTVLFVVLVLACIGWSQQSRAWQKVVTSVWRYAVAVLGLSALFLVGITTVSVYLPIMTTT